MRMCVTVATTDPGIYRVNVDVDGASPPETRVTTAEDGGIQVETVEEPNLLLNVAMWAPIILLLIAAVAFAITSKER